MKTENDEYLVKKYPKIFEQRKWDMKHTCMCWGFECDDGWFNLIDTLCAEIQSYLDKNLGIPQVVAVQVKEKLGGLSFYIEGGDDYTWTLVRNADLMSYSVCENCGSMENVGQTKGWIKTLCEKCMQLPENKGKTWEKRDRI